MNIIFCCHLCFMCEFFYSPVILLIAIVNFFVNRSRIMTPVLFFIQENFDDLIITKIGIVPCKKCDTDLLMSFWRQFGRKWDQIRWKSHHLSKCHGNSMTWTCLKSMEYFCTENEQNLDTWHERVMEFV